MHNVIYESHTKPKLTMKTYDYISNKHSQSLGWTLVDRDVHGTWKEVIKINKGNTNGV